MEENYRLNGLTRCAEEIVDQLKTESGLLTCDFEVIGAILFTKYKGENARMEKLHEDLLKTIHEAEALLESIKNKGNE